MPVVYVEPPPPPAIPIPGHIGASAQWIAPDGTTWPLTAELLGWYTAKGVAGIDAVPVSLTTDAQPRGGARVRHRQPMPRIITWPIQVYGSDEIEFANRWNALVEAFTQTDRLGAGTLEISRSDGRRRRINAYYQDGFDDSLGLAGDGLAALSLFCEDPFWYDPTPLTLERVNTGTLVSFLDPYPTVSDSRLLGDTTLTNPGSWKVWPTWVLTGPLTSLTATNNETGDQFVLTPADIPGASLAAGETVTITTDPPSIRKDNGDNWIGALNWPSAVLWGLDPGTSDVTFTVGGAAAGTKIVLSFNPRYRTCR